MDVYVFSNVTFVTGIITIRNNYAITIKSRIILIQVFFKIIN